MIVDSDTVHSYVLIGLFISRQMYQNFCRENVCVSTKRKQESFEFEGSVGLFIRFFARQGFQSQRVGRALNSGDRMISFSDV